MTELQILVNDQKLFITKRPVIASGGIEENKIKFTFSEHWTGFTKKAVFYNGSSVSEVNITNDECVIPSFVTSAEGIFKVGVYGTLGTAKRTSNVIEYDIKLGTTSIARNPCSDLEAVLDDMIEKYELTGITITRGNWLADLDSVEDVCDAIASQGGSEELDYLLTGLEEIFEVEESEEE